MKEEDFNLINNGKVVTLINALDGLGFGVKSIDYVASFATACRSEIMRGDVPYLTLTLTLKPSA